MILLYVFLAFLFLGVRGDVLDTQAPSLQDATQIYDILLQGQRYKQELQLEKERLLKSIKTFRGNDNEDAGLYRLAGVKLDDFLAFESLVFGMIDIYSNTVNQPITKRTASYDFRTPSIKLTFDFQHAIKESHLHLRSGSLQELQDLTHTPHDDTIKKHAASKGYSPHHIHNEGDEPDSHEAVKEILHSMFRDIRESADQLEEGMHKHNLAFPSAEGHATYETVVKLSDDTRGNGKDVDDYSVLIDQDNNEYVMTRPFDTTVIYEDPQMLHDIVLIVVASFVFGCFFSAVGLPPFFGYIFAGIVTGPSGYNLIKELIQTETLAQLGVVFIVFMLGLEFSFERIRSMWRPALGGALLLLLVTVMFFIVMGTILGATVKEAIFVGACVSLSSTAVVTKCLKGDHLDYLYGLLVMQDILLGFMLAIIPALAESGVQVFIALVKITVSFAIFGLVCYAIFKLIPLLQHNFRGALSKMAFQQNHELILLYTIAVCLMMLIVSNHLGLGMEIGCFAAGVILRSRKTSFEAFHHVVEPVRDLFACLFFASIGLHVYPSFLASEAMLLLTLAGAVIGFKYISTSAVFVLMKVDLRRSSSMAVALAQISEFGFVMASRAKQLHVISREVYYLLIAVTSITLISTPLLIKLMAKLSLSNGTYSSSTVQHLPH